VAARFCHALLSAGLLRNAYVFAVQPSNASDHAGPRGLCGRLPGRGLVKVEECEKQAAQSFAVNATGQRNLALACRQNDAVLVRFSAGNGGNFVKTMLKKASEAAPIRVINDQVLTPTFTEDLAEAVSKLICTDAYGFI
jgi:dTDP-4-dehydrorhamnose reductase